MKNLENKTFNELRKLLNTLDLYERGDAAHIVTECLKRIMDHIQPERSKRDDIGNDDAVL